MNKKTDYINARRQLAKNQLQKALPTLGEHALTKIDRKSAVAQHVRRC
ncbi:MAG: hypothetical protein V4637_03210 [Pseudomonadota bacterium]